MSDLAIGISNEEMTAVLKQYEPLLKKYTFKFHQRAAGLSGAWGEDDVAQELSMIFVRCLRAYEPDKGSSFMNFVINAWYNEMNQRFKRDQRNHNIGQTISGYAVVDDEETNLFDMVDCGHATPEELLEALDCAQFLLSNLSDKARLIVETLLDPPEIVREQFEMQRVGAAQRRDAGMKRFSSKTELSFHFLVDLFGIPARKAREIAREIHEQVGIAFGV